MGDQLFITSSGGSGSAGTTALPSPAWKVSAGTYSSGADALTDLSGNGNNAVFGSSVGVDGNDPKRLVVDATNGRYLRMPNVAGNYLLVSHAAAFEIAGDQSWIIDVALDSYSSLGSPMTLASKYLGGTTKSWSLDVSALGRLQLLLSTNGTTTTTATASQSLGTNGATDGSYQQLRVDWRQSDGRVQFWRRTTEGGSWTQVGTDQTLAAAGSVSIQTSAGVEVSGRAAGVTQPAAMNFYRFRWYSDITQTTNVLDVKVADTTLAEPYVLWSDSSGNAWPISIFRSAAGPKTVAVDYNLLRFGQGSTTYAAVADPAAGTLDFAAAVPMTVTAAFRYSGTPTANQVILAKKADLTTGAGYALYLDSSGYLNGIIADGSTSLTVTSPSALSAGYAHIVSLVRDVANGHLRLDVDGTAGIPKADVLGSLANSEDLRLGRISGAGTNYGDYSGFEWAVYRAAVTTAALIVQASSIQIVTSTAFAPSAGTTVVATTVVESVTLTGELQPRYVRYADGSLALGDGTNAPQPFLSSARSSPAGVSAGGGITRLGYRAGASATYANGTFIGYQAGSQVRGNGGGTTGTGQSLVCVGAFAGMLLQGQEGFAVGYRAGTSCTTGTNNSFTGTHAGESMVSGSRNTIYGNEAFSYATSGDDGVYVGTYAGSVQGLTTSTGTIAGNRNMMFGTWCGQLDANDVNDCFAFGYRTYVKGSYAGAIGNNAQATASGAWAIGTDHAGTAATTSTQDDFVLGTALHAVKVPGTLAVTGNTAVTGNITVTGIGQELFVRKTGDEAVTSSTALQDDDHLLSAVLASCTYMFEALVIYDADTTGDIKIAFTAPTSPTSINWTAMGPATNAATGTASGGWGEVAAAGSSLPFGGIGAGTKLALRVVGLLVNGVNAGNLTLQWAQNASSGTATNVFTNSYLRLRRVA